MSELNKFIIANQKAKNHPLDNDYWHPSAIGGCMRKAVLKRAGVPGEEFDEETLRKFWMGDQIHKALQDTSSLVFNVVSHEAPVVSEDFNLKGSIDTLIYENGLLEVIEFKSVNSMAFKYGSMPYEHHIQQLACYLLVTKADRGRIIYWSKDDGYMQEYIIDNTPELQSETELALLRLSASFIVYTHSGVLPPVLPSVPIIKKGVDTGAEKLNPECRYCPYRTYCFGES